MEQQQAVFDEMMGDTARWRRHLFWEGLEKVEFYLCPQCGAACLNPHQHKAWHIQNGL